MTQSLTPSLIQHANIVHPYTVRKDDLNGYGMMHGGRMLTLCDEVSYLAAHQHARTTCLTRAVHRARFHRGAALGAALEIHTKVGLVGSSSLWVPVEIRSLKEADVVMDAVFVFTALGDDQRPQRVPALAMHNKEDKRIHAVLERMRSQVLQEP